jgi:hypothetical protein
MGDFQDAVKMITAALNTKPENARLRDLLVRYLSSASRYKEALKIALAGIKFDPNLWRLQRHVARLMRANGYKLAPIRGAYEAAVRHNKGDLGLLVEFAAFLFTHSIVADAEISSERRSGSRH